MRNALLRILFFIKHYFTSKSLKGHGIHSPYIFNLITNIILPAIKQPLNANIEKIRQNFLINTQLVEYINLGANKLSTTTYLKINHIARNSVSTPKKCKIINAIAKHYKPTTVIELGTSIGIGTMYLAQANNNTQVITIEGSPQIANIAQETFKVHNFNNILSYVGNFDSILPSILDKLNTPTLWYIDGNHHYEPTLRYFEWALTKFNAENIIIFDDIYWSNKMCQAWQQIKKHPKVTISIDFYYLGIVFFKEVMHRESFKINC